MTLKIDIANVLLIFRFVTRWYLQLKFDSNFYFGKKFSKAAIVIL